MALDNLAPKVLLKVSKKRHVPYIRSDFTFCSYDAIMQF